MLTVIIAIISAVISGILLSYNLYHMRGRLNIVLGTIISSVSTFVIIREFQAQATLLSKYSTVDNWETILAVAASIIPIIILIPIRKQTSQNLKIVTLISITNVFIHMVNRAPETAGIQALINILFILILSGISEDRQANRIKNINDNLLRAQAKYYEDINETDTKIRRIKHDMKNHLIAIEELNKLGDQKKTEEYIQTLRQQITESDTIYRTGNDIADAILNDKVKTARKQGIEIKVEGDLNGLQIDPVDTCTILANLLDNAIEASAKLFGTNANKTIELEFQKSQNFIIITQKNNTINTQTDKTTKQDPNHGFGISNIKDAVRRNDGEIKINILQNEDRINKFEAEIMLPMK